MLPVLRAEDVRDADAAAVAAGTSIDTLMRRAGHAVARAAVAMLGGAYGRRIVILAGAGNNAGDGFVAAAILRRQGAAVRIVACLGDRFEGAAATARDRWNGPLDEPSLLETALARADLVVDALFGVGLSRDVDGVPAKAIAAVAASGVAVLSVDVPSGIDADTGTVRGVAIRADATVTFGGLKPGLLFSPGREHAGRIEVAPIGLRPEATIQSLTRADVRAAWPRREPGGHKRDAGTLLVVAGSTAMPGAAILTCRSAIRAGAGLVTLAAPSAIVAEAIAAVPEATSVPGPGDALGPASAAGIVDAARRSDAIAIGPGLGRDPSTLDAVAHVLATIDLPAVVDADALLAIGAVRRSAPTIVTPHAGEWAAMLGASPDEVAGDRLAAARRLHDSLRDRMPALVVLKGPGTIVGPPWLVDADASPALAQGGSGDVLTGILGSLLARASRRGFVDDASLATLVAAGVWVQARAGSIAAAAGEPAGATRLIEAIPAAIAEAIPMEAADA